MYFFPGGLRICRVRKRRWAQTEFTSKKILLLRCNQRLAGLRNSHSFLYGLTYFPRFDFDRSLTYGQHGKTIGRLVFLGLSSDSL
jgi:hypothetical protein